jgi:uncharacterized protein with HEPN domain
MTDSRSHLHDMLEYLDNISAFTTDGSAVFMSDLKTQYAVIRAYEVIGEIAKRLPATLRDNNPQIDWQTLITFRDFLAHNYQRVILNNIWAAVEDLPNLRANVAALLASLPNDSTP